LLAVEGRLHVVVRVLIVVTVLEMALVLSRRSVIS
jgi:hypothetical protein